MSEGVNLVAVFVANLLGVMICFSLMFSKAMKERLKYENDAKLIFLLIISVILVCIADPIAYFLDGKEGFWCYLGVYISNLWLYIANLVIGVLWVYIVLNNMVKKKVMAQKIITIVVCVIGALILIINFFVPIVFFVDDNNVYSRGPLYLLYTAIQFFFILDGVVVYLIEKIKHGSNANYFPIVHFILPVTIGVIIQSLFYGISLIGPSIAISIGGVVYGLNSVDYAKNAERTFMDDSRNQQSKLLSAFTQNFIEIFYVDPYTGKYSVFSKDKKGFFERQRYGFEKKGNIYDTFFGANSKVYEEDVALCRKVFNYDYLMNIISSGNSESIDIRWGVGETLIWLRVKLVGIEDFEDKEYIAVGVEDVTKELKEVKVKESKQLMWDSIEKSYSSIYMLNVKKNTFSIMKEPEVLSSNDMLNKELPATKFVEIWSKSSVLESDYVNVNKEASMLRIQERLTKEDSYEVIYKEKTDGKTYYKAARVAKTAEYDSKGVIFVGVYDITESVEEQKDKMKTLDEKYKLEKKKYKNKTDFLYRLSRDIRTSLDAVIGYAKMAIIHLDKKEEAVEYIDKISEASNRIGVIVNQVTEMSQIENHEIVLDEQVVDFDERTKAMVTVANLKAEKYGVKIKYNSGEITDKYVKVDSERINQIITNVLENAIKFTPEGGYVEYNTEQLMCSKEGYGLFRFTIEDSGIGMSEEFVENIFDDFSKENDAAGENVEGAGLGLAITKRLVECLDGEIRVSSRLGEGTKVIIDLPFKIASSISDSFDGKEMSSGKSIQGKRILIVEDNTMNREIARGLLEESGLIVEETYDGDLALSKVVEQKAGYYDFILMDIQMPRMNGYDATKAIRSLYDKDKAAVPIIAMSANAFDEDKQNAKDVGMDDYIEKPINIEKLLLVLARFV